MGGDTYILSAMKVFITASSGVGKTAVVGELAIEKHLYDDGLPLCLKLILAY